MDAIRKKMQSLKLEQDQLNATIAKFEDETKASNALNDQYECDIRDLGKKIQGYECDFDETTDKLSKTLTVFEEVMKTFKSTEEDISNMTRRIMLMEAECKKADNALADTVLKLAVTSKDADGILKRVKYFESKTMTNEVEIEELDKGLRETTKIASDSEQK